jgi:death-on-curing protein
MSEPVEYLQVEDLIDLARLLLGDPPPIRDIGLLSSAAARPQATAFGEDAYTGVSTKAAALLQSIVNNHALIDGNKRLGWLATAVFLELNGVEVVEKLSNDQVFGLVMWVASATPELSAIVGRLNALLDL